jgi:hypothetical protein
VQAHQALLVVIRLLTALLLPVVVGVAVEGQVPRLQQVVAVVVLLVLGLIVLGLL